MKCLNKFVLLWIPNSIQKIKLRMPTHSLYVVDLTLCCTLNTPRQVLQPLTTPELNCDFYIRPHLRNQIYTSLDFRDISYLQFKSTLYITRPAWPHPLKMTGSVCCFYEWSTHIRYFTFNNSVIWLDHSILGLN